MALLGTKPNSTNPFDDLHVAPGFDEIVGEKMDTVIALSVDVDLLPAGCRRDKSAENPSQRVKKYADSSGAVGGSVGPKRVL